MLASQSNLYYLGIIKQRNTRNMNNIAEQFAATPEFKKMEEIATGFVLHGKPVPSMRELFIMAQEQLIEVATKRENIHGLSDKVYQRIHS